jgi:hypothetical protein
VNIGYVWNHTEAPAPDRDELVLLAEDYAASCTTEDFYVTNGAAWYVTHGDSNDWSYGRYGTWEFTLELSKRKLLEPDAIEVVLEEHAVGLERFVLQPLDEVMVVDARTGVPLEAWVERPGGQPRWTLPTSGRAGLVALPNREVWVGALGYRSAVAELGSTVALEPVSVADVPASPPWIPPVRGTVQLPGTGATRVLHKVGEDPIVVSVDRFGRGRIPGGSMRPGWWTVEDEGGTVFPRALAVGLEPAAEGLWPDVSAGARAYVLGEHREVVEIDVGAAGTPLPQRAVWLVDASGERLLVAGASSEEEVALRGAGCASTPQTGHFALLWVSIAAGRVRRRPKERRSAERANEGGRGDGR